MTLRQGDRVFSPDFDLFGTIQEVIPHQAVVPMVTDGRAIYHLQGTAYQTARVLFDDFKATLGNLGAVDLNRYETANLMRTER